MRIALVCSDKGPCPPIKGGAIQLLISRVAPLLARKHPVTVFSITDSKLLQRETVQGVRYERYPQETFFTNVCDRLKEERFDVIQIYNRPTWIPAIRETAPEAVILLSMHNTIYQILKEMQAEAESSFREADCILTVSRFVAENTLKKVPDASGKIQVLYTGVDLNEYEPVWTQKGQQWRKETREKYWIEDKDPVLLFVGRLVPYKGCHLVLRAMEQILKTHEKAKLLIVGSKWYADDTASPYIEVLHSLTREIPENVIFTSYVPVDDIPKYYAAADLLICASQWMEPLARIHYEAMAAGLPIITTQRGGNHEVILDGVNGLVIKDYKNPSKFAKASTNLLDNPKRSRKMGMSGRELAEKIYNFERVAADLLLIYHSLANIRKKRRGKSIEGTKS